MKKISIKFKNLNIHCKKSWSYFIITLHVLLQIVWIFIVIHTSAVTIDKYTITYNTETTKKSWVYKVTVLLRIYVGYNTHSIIIKLISNKKWYAFIIQYNSFFFFVELIQIKYLYIVIETFFLPKNLLKTKNLHVLKDVTLKQFKKFLCEIFAV